MFEPVANSGVPLNIVVHAAIYIGAFVALLYYLTKKDARIYKYLKAIDGPAPLPFVGNALSLLGPHERKYFSGVNSISFNKFTVLVQSLAIFDNRFDRGCNGMGQEARKLIWCLDWKRSLRYCSQCV